MAYDNSRLYALRQQIARKQHLTQVSTELQQQEAQLVRQLGTLEAAMRTEQAQVDTLEGKSLSALFYQVIGKLEEKLDKERAEAYAARVKYDTAFQSLQAVRHDLARCQTELASLEGCEGAYTRTLEEKLSLLKQAGVPQVSTISDLESTLSSITAKQTELREAIAAGKTALASAQDVIVALEGADSLATFDIFGGGLLTDLAKHHDLDAAQEHVNTLQKQLLRFRSELADVSLEANIHISMGDFMHFADFFFDGLFADIAVSEHISNALEEARATRNRISDILERLQQMLEDSKTQSAAADQQLKDLVLHATL